MCNHYLIRQRRNCMITGKFNGYCGRHRNVAHPQPPQQNHQIQTRISEEIPEWARPNEEIPEWALVMPDENKEQEYLTPLPMTNTFIISSTPGEHFGNLMILHGEKKLKLLLKNSKLENFVCQICFMDDLNAGDIYVFEECNHYYCLECLNHTLKIKVNDRAVDNLSCPCDGCDHKITHNEIRCILSSDKDLWKKYDQKLFDLTLGQMEDVRYCPKPNCGTAMCGSKNAPMMTCPGCKFQSCFNCKEEYHIGITCDKYQIWKKENGKGDVEFEKWVKKNAKPCPRCKAPIERKDGCNHMTCGNCKYHFHWVTLAKWKGYNKERNVWGTADNPIPLNQVRPQPNQVPPPNQARPRRRRRRRRQAPAPVLAPQQGIIAAFGRLVQGIRG